MTIQDAVPKLIQLEGEILEDVPDDHGGATKNGVIQSEYDSFRDNKGLSRQSVGLMTDAEMYEIYDTEYWTKGGCGLLPNGLDFVHFQWCVNHGVESATRCLKTALFSRPQVGELDGPLSDHDASRFSVWGSLNIVIERYLAIQSATYDRISQNHGEGQPETQLKFFNGWENRIQRVRDVLAGRPLSV
jgi:lysozyme family protein